MKTLMVVLKVLGWIWVVLGAALIAVGIAGVWMAEGFAGVQRVMSPFNVMNFLVTMVIMGPGFLALYWAGRIKEKLAWQAYQARQAAAGGPQERV